MADSHRSSNFRKTKRNFSDIEGNFMFVRNKQEMWGQKEIFKPKANSIKINRNKLPSDFFPRSQSLRRKPSVARPSLTDDKRSYGDVYHKAQPHRDEIFPEKTSFFGFFSENQISNKNQSNTLNLKRKFQSREEPKRQKMIPESRKFTPMNGIHRADLLNLFPSSHDSNLTQSIVLSARTRGIPIKIKGGEEPGSRKRDKASLAIPSTQMVRSGQNNNIQEDIGNITFFNSKSNSLPPINQGKN